MAPSTYFSDTVLTRWLEANRNINFTRPMRAVWSGATDDSTIFYLTGSTSDIDVEDMSVWVPKTAGADRYAPEVFALITGQTSNQTVTSSTPLMRHIMRYPGIYRFPV
jgi:hypothetical protein